MDTISVYVGLVITSVFNGIGIAIGTYLANRHINKKIEMLTDKFNKKVEI